MGVTLSKSGRLPDKAPIVIAGAGILGLTLARELVHRTGAEIVLLEKEDRIGCHASGRNSGVLHAGIYYHPESLKAQICLTGNRLMQAYCRQNDLPLRNCGKVIVARSRSELPVLKTLYHRARINGARVELIDTQALARIEPDARTWRWALWSKDTAQVDPQAVLRQLQDDLTRSGSVQIHTNCRFSGLIATRTARTSRGRITFERFINCAGAHCDRVAHSFGLARNYRLVPFKGIYYRLKRKAAAFINGNIYPVPDIRNPFLGVHFTRTIHGEVAVGPTAIPALGRENYGLLTGMDAEGPQIVMTNLKLAAANPKFRTVAASEPRKYWLPWFYQDARRLVKNLRSSDLEASPKTGIRAQLVDLRCGELVMDFKVLQDDSGLHLLNPVSPAFTCSMALARILVRSYF